MSDWTVARPRLHDMKMLMKVVDFKVLNTIVKCQAVKSSVEPLIVHIHVISYFYHSLDF